jgi:hypothetical protein
MVERLRGEEAPVSAVGQAGQESGGAGPVASVGVGLVGVEQVLSRRSWSAPAVSSIQRATARVKAVSSLERSGL